MQQLGLRIVCSIILVAAGFLLPWWVVVGIALISALVIRNYWEIIIIGLLYDVVFHIPALPWYQSGTHTLILFAVFFVTAVIHLTINRPKQFL